MLQLIVCHCLHVLYNNLKGVVGIYYERLGLSPEQKQFTVGADPDKGKDLGFFFFSQHQVIEQFSVFSLISQGIIYGSLTGIFRLLVPITPFTLGKKPANTTTGFCLKCECAYLALTC